MIAFVSLILEIVGIALLGYGVIGVLLVMIFKIPTVALIDVRNIPVDRAERMKEQIIAERIVRTFAKKTAPMGRGAAAVWGWIQARFRRIAHLVFSLERKSEILARQGWDALTAAGRVHALIREAEALEREDLLIEAEKKYIQGIALDMKNSKLYEALGNLYIKMRQYDLARETLRFAARLAPNDASVITSLGEVAFERKEYTDAITYFQHAVSLRPRSPRYLDFLVEACILGGNQSCAQETLAKLIAVNPDNAKIHGFEKRIREM